MAKARLLLLLLMLTMSGCSIISFNKLTTDVTGVVLLNGQPVDGAVIQFHADSGWYGKWKARAVATDDHGRFTVPQWRNTRVLVLVHQPVIHQQLIIEHAGQEYDGWRYTRMTYTDRSDRPTGIFLTCELTSEVSTHRLSDFRAGSGICTPREQD